VDAFDTADERRRAIADSDKPWCQVLDLLIQGDNHNIASPSCLISAIKEEQKAIEQKMGNFQQATNIQLLKAALNQVKDEHAVAKLKKTAELAANAAERVKNLKTVYIGDILMNQRGNPASAKFDRYVRSMIREGGWNVELGNGRLTGWQLMQIKLRLEKRNEKLNKVRAKQKDSE